MTAPTTMIGRPAGGLAQPAHTEAPDMAEVAELVDMQLVSPLTVEVVLPRDAAVLVACALQDLPDLLAQAWDEGHRASERDWEMAYSMAPDEDRQPWTNPYRQEG